MGRLVRDPELRHTGTGKPVATFTIAVDNGYGEGKKTDFINCVAWNKTAEFVSKWFAKGRMMVLVGRLSTRAWEGEDGRKNYVTEVVVNEVTFADEKREDTTADSSNDDFTPIDANDDDVPF